MKRKITTVIMITCIILLIFSGISFSKSRDEIIANRLTAAKNTLSSALEVYQARLNDLADITTEQRILNDINTTNTSITNLRTTVSSISSVRGAASTVKSIRNIIDDMEDIRRFILVEKRSKSMITWADRVNNSIFSKTRHTINYLHSRGVPISSEDAAFNTTITNLNTLTNRANNALSDLRDEKSIVATEAKMRQAQSRFDVDKPIAEEIFRNISRLLINASK